MHIMGILLREYKGKCHIKGKHRRLEETIHVHAEVGKNIKNVVENKKKNCFYALSILRLCTIINPIREA